MDKTVKISASIDEISFNKALSKVDLLISKMKELAQVSKDMGGGILGVSGSRTVSGTGKSGTPTKSQSVNVGVGGVDSLSKAAEGYKKTGDAAKVALKGMSDAFKDHVGASTREGQKLLQELGNLEKGLDRIQKKAAGLRGGGGIPGLPDATQAEREAIMPSWQRQLRVANRFGGPASDFTHAELASIQSPMGRFMSGLGGRMNSPISFTPQMPGAQGSLLGRGMNMMGFGGGSMALGIAGGVGAVGAAVNYAMEQRHANQLANLEYQTQHKPFVTASRAATAGQFFGGNALAMRGGDIGRAGALRGLATDQNFLSLVGDQRVGMQKFMIDKTNSTGFWQNPTFGNARSQFTNWVGGSASKMTDFIGGQEIPGLNTTAANEIRNQMKKDYVGSRGVEDLGKMLDLKMQEDPLKMAVKNNLAAGAMGDIGLSRSAGLSGGIGWRKNRITGQMEKYDTVLDFKARSKNTLYSEGETSGQMMQTLAASGGRGGVGTAAGLMNASYGGFSNATSMYGLGAQFGASGFYGGFSRMMGGKFGVGGVAGSHIGGAVEAGMNSGDFTGFGGKDVGLGFAGTMMDATYSGNAGTDILRGRQVQGGMGAMAGVMSGGVDPLQQAFNMSAALKAMPKGSYEAHKALMDMTPATRMEILRSGKLPAWMSDSGVGLGDVKSYVGAQTATGLSRLSDSMFTPGGANAATLSRYRAAGGVSYMKGMKGTEREAEVSRLGHLLKMSGVANTEDAGKGLVRLQLAEGRFGNVAHGGGVGAAINRGSARAHSVKTAGLQDADEGEQVVGLDEEIHGDIASLRGQKKGLEKGRRIAQQGAAGSADDAIAGVQVALQAFVNALKGMAPATGHARAGAPKP